MAFFSMTTFNSTSDRINDRIAKGYQVRSSLYLKMSMDLVKQNLGMYVTFTLIYIAFMVLVWRLGETGSFLNIIFSGPISAGYYSVIHRTVSGRSLTFENFFDGFKIFLPVMTISMTSGLLTSLGALLYIVPGLVIAIFLIFTMPLTIYTKADVFSAIKISQKIVAKQFWEISKLALYIALINIAAIFTFGIGLLFTLPMSFAVIYFAYDDIIGINDDVEEKPNFNHFR
jgi:uncharacterized membrane protein